jgi:CRP-like cAMP-binding protein
MDQSTSPSSSEDMAKQLAARTMSGSLDLVAVQMLANGAEQVRLEPGEMLFRQGDPSDALFVVLSGRLEAIVTNEGDEQVVGDLGANDVIGEMQILSGKPRAAGIRAVTNATLAKITKSTFEEIAQKHPAFLARIGQIVEARLRRNQLFEALPQLFGPLDLDIMREIQKRLEWVFLQRGEILLKQGEIVQEFYILINGRLIAKNADARGQEKTVSEVIAGESIGETQLLTQDKSSVTIYAARDSELVKFSEEEFNWMLDSYPNVCTGG